MIRPDSVRIIADSVGVKISAQGVEQLCADIEQRVRWLLEDARDLLGVTRRTHLASDDVNALLRANGVESLFGYESGDRVLYKSVGPSHSHADDALFFEDDQIVDLNQFIEQPLPASVDCVALESDLTVFFPPVHRSNLNSLCIGLLSMVTFVERNGIQRCN